MDYFSHGLLATMPCIAQLNICTLCVLVLGICSMGHIFAAFIFLQLYISKFLRCANGGFMYYFCMVVLCVYRTVYSFVFFQCLSIVGYCVQHCCCLAIFLCCAIFMLMDQVDLKHNLSLNLTYTRFWNVLCLSLMLVVLLLCVPLYLFNYIFLFKYFYTACTLSFSTFLNFTLFVFLYLYPCSVFPIDCCTHLFYVYGLC